MKQNPQPYSLAWQWTPGHKIQKISIKSIKDFSDFKEDTQKWLHESKKKMRINTWVMNEQTLTQDLRIEFNQEI